MRIVILTILSFVIQTFYAHPAVASDTMSLYRCTEPKGMSASWGDFLNINGESFQNFEDGAKWSTDGSGTRVHTNFPFKQS
jgi:hypothetical protein